LNKKKKIFFWLTGGACVLVLLVAALLFLGPLLVDSEPVKKRIESFISEKIEGKVECQKVRLAFFPRPHAGMDQVRISIPGTLEGKIGALLVSLELVPLLEGDIRIASFHIEAPEVTLSLSKKTAQEESSPITLRRIQERLTSLLSIIDSKIPGLRAEVTKGRLQLLDADKPLFLFQNIQGQFALSPGSLQFDLSCGSNLFERFTFNGNFNPDGFTGDGVIRVDSLLPHVLAASLVSDTLPLVGESKVNLNVRLKLDRPGALQAELEASSPYLTLQRGGAKQVIKIRTLQATLSHEDEITRVSLARLGLEDPPFNLAGTVVMDRKASQMRLEMESWDLNFAPLREAALSIAGDVPIIQTICSVVKGGTIPRVLFQTWGSSVADLGATENILIKASLRDGRISIRGPGLELEQVKGDAVISKGILKGQELEARLEKSRGRKGTMILGLKGDDAPFELDISVQADLPEVVSHLKRLVKNKPFQNEISQISNLRGSAQGRLVLGKTLSSTNVRVEASGIQLSAGYRPLPYPVEITQGQFTYDEFKGMARVQDLNGKLGTSSFSGTTAQVGLGKSSSIEILSARILARLDELYPWLSSQHGFGSSLKEIPSVKGLLDMSQVRLQGPVSNPERWQFEAAGELRDIRATTSLFKDPILVTRAKFNVTPQKLSFTDLQGRLLDAPLSASGTLVPFLTGTPKIEVTFGATMGPEATQWISKVVQLPPGLSLRSPFSVSPAQLTLEGKGASKISFRGKLVFENGPDVSTDLVVTPQEVAIRELLIQDKMSRASIGLTLGKSVAVLKFSGELNGKTLDRMLQGNELPAQWMKGNLQARIHLDQPWFSTADGDMEGRDIHFTLTQIGRVDIDRISLEATKSNVRVNSAAFRWKDKPFSFNGVTSVSPKGIEFDMDLSTQTLDFNTVSQALLRKDEKSGAETTGSTRTPPIKGVIRFKTERFAFGGFTWTPLHADVSIDKEGVSIRALRGSVCGVSTLGSLRISEQGMDMEARPTALNQDLEPAILCVTDKKTDITGVYTLNGQLKAKGKTDDILRSLQGDVRFTARDGQILYYSILAKVFTFLSVTDLLRGKLPDFTMEGFLYDSINLDGKIVDGKLTLKEFIIDGRQVDLIASGEVDLANQRLDVKVLVAPFKTVDFLVRLIPPLSYVFGGNLIIVPVRVSGDLRDPKVTVLSPSAVGSELLAPMKRIINIPFKVIDLFLPSEKAE
jgi:hypothetical protein